MNIQERILSNNQTTLLLLYVSGVRESGAGRERGERLLQNRGTCLNRVGYDWALAIARPPVSKMPIWV